MTILSDWYETLPDFIKNKFSLEDLSEDDIKKMSDIELLKWLSEMFKNRENNKVLSNYHVDPELASRIDTVTLKFIQSLNHMIKSEVVLDYKIILEAKEDFDKSLKSL